DTRRGRYGAVRHELRGSGQMKRHDLALRTCVARPLRRKGRRFALRGDRRQRARYFGRSVHAHATLHIMDALASLLPPKRSPVPCPSSALEHDLFRKPASTFRDHALSTRARLAPLQKFLKQLLVVLGGAGLAAARTHELIELVALAHRRLVL